VKNGMLFGRARKLCPNLQPIPYDFEAYRSVSQLLYDTVARWVASFYTPLTLCTPPFDGFDTPACPLLLFSDSDCEDNCNLERIVGFETSDV